MNPAIHPIDLVIVVLYLLGVLGLGIWVGRGQRDSTDYLLGARSIPWGALLISIVATETSTATFLSAPGEAFAGNMAFLQLAVGYVVGRYLVVFLLLPLYFRGELFTAYEVLNRRFGGWVKRGASLLFIVTRSMADGLRLYLAAIVLRKMLFPPTAAGATIGFDYELTTAVVIVGVATIIYTFFGGMKAVVWTDVVQFLIYIFGALLAMCVIAYQLPGGWSAVIEFGRQRGKFEIFDFSTDLTRAYTYWAGLIGGAFFSLSSHGADQMMVQRYLSAKSQRDAGRAVMLSGWVVLAQFALFLLLGVGLAAFYDHQGRTFAKSDEVFPAFLIEQLPPGATGITLAAVFAAAMSTLSSSLNSSAAAATYDFYVPLLKPNASPRHILGITRALTIFFGLVQIGIAVVGQYLVGSVITNVMAIAGFTTGVILGLFFLGIFSRRAGQGAALCAMLVGLATMSGIAFQTQLAWPWYAVLGSLGTLLVGVVASLLIPQESEIEQATDSKS